MPDPPADAAPAEAYEVISAPSFPMVVGVWFAVGSVPRWLAPVGDIRVPARSIVRIPPAAGRRGVCAVHTLRLLHMNNAFVSISTALGMRRRERTQSVKTRDSPLPAC